jgi:hypothetical protein
MEKQLTNKGPSGRKRRSPLEGRSKLKVKDTDPNYHYRIVNCNLESDPDRVADLQEIGYEIVPQKATGRVGDKQVDTPSAVGSAGEISVGRGTKAVVMRIPKEYFQEDQAAKRALDLERESGAKKSADYGSVDVSVKRTPD